MPPKTREVGQKQKGEDLEAPHKKKQKTDDNKDQDDGDEFEKLLEALPKEAKESKMFGSNESWNEKLAKKLNISAKDAALLPIDIKRIASNYEVYDLLSKAIDAEKLRDFEELKKVSRRLQQITNMIAYFQKRADLKQKKDGEGEENEDKRNGPESRLLAEQKMYFLNMKAKRVELWSGTDSAMINHTSDTEFVWLGNNARYVRVKQHQLDGHDHSSLIGDWVEFEYTIALRELGSSKEEEVKVTFKTETAVKKEKDFPPKDELWIKYVENEVKKVSDWLDLDLSSEDCAHVLYDVVKQYCNNYRKHIYYEDPYSGVSKEDIENYKRVWNGQTAEELQRLMKMLLADEQGWAKEIAFVAKRIVAKLKVMQLIKKADKIGDQACNELLALVENAGIRCKPTMIYKILTNRQSDDFMNDAVFYQPKLMKDVLFCKAVVHEHKYILVFSKQGKIVVEIYVHFSIADSEESDFDVTEAAYGGGDEPVSDIVFPDEVTDKNRSITNDERNTKENKERFIQDLELKHVTTDDLTAFLEALIVYPEITKKKQAAKEQS